MSDSTVRFTDIGSINGERTESGKLYHEFLRVRSMSAGLYVLPMGAMDPQHPHHEDEMYYVLRGKARFTANGQDREVSAGSVIFVPAEMEHRFHDIAEELAVLVFFSPAEGYGQV